jgi:hypothetical protein
VRARSDAPSGIPFDGIVWRERLRTGHFSRAYVRLLTVFCLTSLAKRESVRFTLAKRISSKQGLAKRDSSKRPLAKRKSSRLQTPRLGDSAKSDPHRNLPSSGMLPLFENRPA